MPTDRAAHIQATRVVDTHTYLGGDRYWAEGARDALADLIGRYTLDDLDAATGWIDSIVPSDEGHIVGGRLPNSHLGRFPRYPLLTRRARPRIIANQNHRPSDEGRNMAPHAGHYRLLGLLLRATAPA